MEILDRVYASLHARDHVNVDIPTSDVFYARAAIEAKLGIRLDIYQVQQYLEEEGLLKQPKQRRYEKDLS